MANKASNKVLDRVSNLIALNYITTEQYKEIEARNDALDTDGVNKLLKEYVGIEAVPYTGYSYYDSTGDYLGDSNTSSFYDLLDSAYIKVKDVIKKGN